MPPFHRTPGPSRNDAKTYSCILVEATQSPPIPNTGAPSTLTYEPVNIHTLQAANRPGMCALRRHLCSGPLHPPRFQIFLNECAHIALNHVGKKTLTFRSWKLNNGRSAKSATTALPCRESPCNEQNETWFTRFARQSAEEPSILTPKPRNLRYDQVRTVPLNSFRTVTS
jgi:hypothetical protein